MATSAPNSVQSEDSPEPWWACKPSNNDEASHGSMRPTRYLAAGGPGHLPLHLPPRAALNSAPRTITRVVVVGFAGNPARPTKPGHFVAIQPMSRTRRLWEQVTGRQCSLFLNAFGQRKQEVPQ